ncbi:GIY-YIG nuclease family protein [Streptomyces bauhiniae]|uniref:Bacteriophage T5 Orf172 DNA-binding domain-containing protein n=1 Tax=Streptomyces bauhiniae TaxID=2340725 RepID=A0A7K3QRA9_9ACTN|nr:hypothetical protein [Streptomyces bauhiniae]
MTAAPQPLGRLAASFDRIVCGITWATQVAAATAYLGAAGHLSAWRDLFAKDAVGTVILWCSGLCMAALWGISLREEARSYYNRQHQRLYRKAGLLGHVGTLLIAALAASKLPHQVAWFALLGTVSFAAVATWASWMQARLLPDEDQAVVDAILHREAAQRAAVFDASDRERRRARLAVIVESLGYTLNDAGAPTTSPAEPPAIRWTIPAGKHAPLVYFIRNGNRMKIGTTTELKRRIRTLALRPENVALLVAGDQRRERDYHKQFAEHRIGTTEWFAYEGTLADYVHDQTARLSQKEQQQ